MRATCLTHLILLDRINYRKANSVIGRILIFIRLIIMQVAITDTTFYQIHSRNTLLKAASNCSISLHSHKLFGYKLFLISSSYYTSLLPAALCNFNYGVTALLMILVWSVIAGAMIPLCEWHYTQEFDALSYQWSTDQCVSICNRWLLKFTFSVWGSCLDLSVLVLPLSTLHVCMP
jgi:hypothetical protein